MANAPIRIAYLDPRACAISHSPIGGSAKARLRALIFVADQLRNGSSPARWPRRPADRSCSRSSTSPGSIITASASALPRRRTTRTAGCWSRLPPRSRSASPGGFARKKRAATSWRWRWFWAERLAISSIGCNSAMSSTSSTCILARSGPFMSLMSATRRLASASSSCCSAPFFIREKAPEGTNEHA